MSHSAWLTTLARSLVHDPAAADDLVQETWLAALKSPPDPARPARPWLAGVMRKLVAMRARGEGRRARRHRSAARGEELPSTAELVEGVDTQRRIARAVLELAEPYRTTVLLRYYRGMSSADIARRQEIPAGTVRWRLQRGLEQLREGLDQLWPDRRSWCLALLALERGGATVGGAASLPVAAGSGLGALLGFLPWSALLVLAATLGWLGVQRLMPAGTAQPEPLAPTPSAAPDLAEGSGPPRDGAREALRVAGAEGAATRSATPVAAGATPSLRILQPDGSPAGSLRAVVLGADGEVVEGSTDEAGRFDLGALARPATLFVKRPDAFLDRAALPAGPDEHVVRLAAGQELAGRIHLAGAAPHEAIALSLTRDQPLFGDDDAPEPVRERMRSARLAHCATQPDGSFRFVGLAADWHGTLRLPPGYRFAVAEDAQGRVLSLSAPASGLEIEVVPERRLHGRATAEGRPVAASLDCTFEREGAAPRDVSLSAAADGSFGIAILGPCTSARVRASMTLADGAVLVASAWVPLDGEPQAGDVDLGVLELQASRVLEVEAQDASGRPIHGLEVGVLQLDGRRAWSADPGLGPVVRIELPVSAATDVVADAFGYRAQRLASTRGLGPRVVVELEPSPTLVVFASAAQGAPRSGARVRLAGVAADFAQTLRPVLGRSLLGRSPGGGPESAGGSAAPLLECDSEGRLALDGFHGDEQLELALLDPLDNVLMLRRLALDGAREHLVELRLPGDLPVFSGTVRDDAGEPLVGAAIVLVGRAGASWRLRTDREGHFEVVHGQRAAVRVEISKEGFETLALDGVLIADSTPRTFGLREKAR